jgi:hypothetical protein
VERGGPFLHVRNLCGRPADVEHRREEAVAGGPDEVRVCPQDGAEQAATEDRGEGNAHQDGSSDVPQLETAKPVDLKDSTSSFTDSLEWVYNQHLRCTLIRAVPSRLPGSSSARLQPDLKASQWLHPCKMSSSLLVSGAAKTRLST